MEANIIGPVLPEYLSKDILINKSENVSVDSYGPQLPPHLLKAKQDKISSSSAKNDTDDADVIGPLPAGIASTSATQQALEERAEILKYQFLLQNTDKSDTERKRESWMTELPPEKSANFGLGSRSFKINDSGDKSNRSAWTETPNDKKNKQKQVNDNEDDHFEVAAIVQRNEVMDEIVKKSKKHKKEKKSLLELHKQKLKKKKKDKHKDKQERKPFDRDTDLQVNRFDEAQKNAIIKKAQLLDTRFSSGKSKYL